MLAVLLVLASGSAAAWPLGDPLVEIPVHQERGAVAFTFSQEGKTARVRDLYVEKEHSRVSLRLIRRQGYDWSLRIEYGAIPEGLGRGFPPAGYA